MIVERGVHYFSGGRRSLRIFRVNAIDAPMISVEKNHMVVPCLCFTVFNVHASFCGQRIRDKIYQCLMHALVFLAFVVKESQRLQSFIHKNKA